MSIHPTLLQPEALANITHFIPDLSSYSQFVILSHPSIYQLYGTRIAASLKNLGRPIHELMIPEGERSKNLQQAARCWKKMGQWGVDRQAAFITLGGGVISDLGGFIANCYMRGLDTFYLPTTLMAMVDASIGGKTGINLPQAKNAVGTFYSPKLVVIDPTCLRTLPQREFNSGLAEVIKYGVIMSSRFFEILENTIEEIKERHPSPLNSIIEACLAFKQEIVAKDPKDLIGERAVLNYGHTVGHAIESTTRYRPFLHGEAVAMGMSCAALISVKLDLCESNLCERQDDLCRRADLPIDLPRLSIERLFSALKGDKKCVHGKITLILPKKIGKVERISDLDPSLIKQVLLSKMK